MRSIQHPNVVKLYAVYESAAYVYLVLEYIDGGSLRERLAAAKKLDEKLTRTIVHSILDVLRHLHS